MAAKGKAQAHKGTKTAKNIDGTEYSYSVPNARSWTVKYWKDSGLLHKDIAKLMGISEQVVGHELKVMRVAQAAGFDAEKLHKSLGSLVPQAVPAVSGGMADGGGTPGLHFLTGYGA